MGDPSQRSRYLRPKDVVTRYRISIPTVYRWRRDKKISSISKDGITLMEVESLEAYLRTWKRRGKEKE